MYPAHMKTLRVLVADDQAHVREGLRAVLCLAGNAGGCRIEVIGEARDGIEAVRQAQALRPDVILMDLEMPGMDGCEATRRIRDVLPAVRVVMLSIHGGTQARHRAANAGADRYVEKGSGLESLMQAILGIQTPDKGIE